MTLVLELIRSEAGANATEYALLASLIAVALIAGAQALGTALNTAISGVSDAVPSL